jgi:hypothetical protein
MVRTGKFVLLFSLCVLMCIAVSAQTTTGTILGTVTDNTGAPIPNAKVTATNVAKGTTASTTSNASGDYTITQLIPDVYTVTVRVAGFETFTQANVTVHADEGVKVDAPMKIGTVEQQVEVTSAPPLLKVDREDVSYTLTAQQVANTPVVNRNFTDLELLLPGASQLGWNHASSENPQRSAQINVDGQQFSGVDYMLDGTDNRDPILGIIVVNPNLDAVQEVKMTTGDYDAEFGALSAVMSAQTKSGTNQLHGEGYDFIQNDSLMLARDPFLQSTVNPITGKYTNPLRYNQFGGTIGGPIVKDKLFFFGDYQALIRHRSSNAETFVPTNAERGGDWSALLPGYPIYDPQSSSNPAARTQFPGNVIPASRIDPISTKIMNMLPQPNFVGPNPSVNYLGTGTEIFHNNAFDTREDWAINSKSALFGRYSLSQYSLTAPGVFGSILGGPALQNVNFAGQSTSRDQSLALGYTYTFSPTLLSDTRVGFYRYRVNVDNPTLGTSYANQLGIPGVNLGDYFTSGFPSFEMDGQGSAVGTTSLGYAVHNIANNNQCNCPLRENEYQLQVVNNWTKMSGDHEFKFGADLRHAHNLRVPSDNSRNGQFFFRNNVTSLQGNNQSGAGWASFELGTVSQFMRYVSTVTNAAESQNRFFLYGQDAWRVTPNLTVNYGLRWSYYQPQHVNCTACGGWFDFNNANMIVGGAGPYNLAGNVQPQYTDFAPRLGVAYQLNQKTVVRVGYGRSYDVGVFGTIFGHTVTQNLPVLAFQDVEPTNPFNGSFQINAGPPSGLALFPNPSVYQNTGEFPLPQGVNPHADERKLVIPSVDSWNLAVQRQITANSALTLTYLGEKGTHLGTTPNINAPVTIPSPSDTTGGLDLSPYFRKFGLTQGITDYCNCDSNNYNALQAVFNHTYSHGLTANVNYTWSRSMGFNDNWFYGWRYGYGPTGYDITHVLNISHVYELPFGKGKSFLSSANGPLNQLVGGWSLNGGWAFHSGLATTPSYSGNGCYNCPFQTWPDRVGDPYSGNGAGGEQHFWNVAAFQAVPPTSVTGVQRQGSAGLNSLRGPAFWTSNLSLYKTFSLTERTKLAFRLDAYNAFNHDNWAVPDSNIQDSGFGTITGTQQFAQDEPNMRWGELGLKLIF